MGFVTTAVDLSLGNTTHCKRLSAPSHRRLPLCRPLQKGAWHTLRLLGHTVVCTAVCNNRGVYLFRRQLKSGTINQEPGTASSELQAPKLRRPRLKPQHSGRSSRQPPVPSLQIKPHETGTASGENPPTLRSNRPATVHHLELLKPPFVHERTNCSLEIYASFMKEISSLVTEVGS